MKYFKGCKERLARFTEGYGFALIVTLCVAVMTGSAVWTSQHQQPNPQASPSMYDADRSAALLMQQSLRSAVTPTPLPVPTVQPAAAWKSPLTEYEWLRGYDMQKMYKSDVTGIWTVHDGVDLAARKGQAVYSVGDGKVMDCGTDPLMGSWLSASYSDDLTVTYAGMAMLGAIKTGDILHAGQTIGFVGTGPLDEQHLDPHLHLSAMHDGHSVDPSFLLNGT